MKIAFLGCGLIGEKRAAQIGNHENAGFFDPNVDRMQKLAHQFKAKCFTSEDDLINNSGADIVVIASINSTLAPLTLKALKAGKHVLVEKPGAVNVSELLEVKKLSEEKKLRVKVGFNHRFHPAMLKAEELISSGQLGELMFCRARYGHGARVGYEKEWRNDPKTGGGGELLDQGVHILDLIYWYFGDLPLVNSHVTTAFWDMKVDDNAVLTVAKGKQFATFHVSCSEWKNTFAIEIYGRTGKIFVSGLGRSYGKETLTYYKMLPQMGPPETTVIDFDETDKSWGLDLENLIEAVKDPKKPLWGDVNSALYSLKQVQKAYVQNGFSHLPCSASY